MASTEFVYPKWDYKIEFLRKLYKKNNKVLEELSNSPFSKILGNLNDVVSELIKDDLLRISSFEESVSMLMTVPKIKEYLKSKGIKCTGKKEELVKRAIDIFSFDEKANIEETGRLYLITAKGWEIIEKDRERFKNEAESFQKALLEPLANSDFETVFREVTGFYSTYQFPVGIGTNGGNCLCERTKEVAKQMMCSSFLTGSMNLEVELEKRIRAIVTMNYVFSFRIADFDLVGNMLNVYPEFSCPEIEGLLKTGLTGIFSNNDADNKSDVIEVFYHAIWTEAVNSVELRNILESDIKNRYCGIEILSGCNSCDICNGVNSYYTWEQIGKLPKLPKYPGCTCSYFFLANPN
jgi:SAP domain